VSGAADALPVLQAVRLKGRVARAELTGVDALADAGLLTDGASVRLTAQGRARLAELLAEERADVDGAAAERVYERFGPINAEFKTAVSQWQLEKGGPAAEEAAARVLARVGELHAAVAPVLADAATLVARLGVYTGRLDEALRRARAGDMTWLTRPLVDSYHTVWFELHEELIGLAGRTRAGEAESGGAG
jgi:hypothetical protein